MKAQLLNKYESWFWENILIDEFAPIDYFIAYNTISLLQFKLTASQTSLTNEIKTYIENISEKELFTVPKFQILLSSYLMQNPQSDLTVFIRSWLSYLHMHIEHTNDYSFPYYFMFHMPTINPQVIKNCEENSFKTVLQYDKAIRSASMDSFNINLIKANLILHFQNDNFMVGCDLLKVLMSLNIYDFITKSCINKLILNFSVNGYFGLYQKKSFSENEKRYILMRTLEVFIVLLQYWDHSEPLEKIIYEYHL